MVSAQKSDSRPNRFGEFSFLNLLNLIDSKEFGNSLGDIVNSFWIIPQDLSFVLVRNIQR
jgi:hypothetical protein